MMVKKAQTLTKIDMKTLSKPVLLDFLVIFQHILVFFFYILLVYKWENQFQIGNFRQSRFKEIWEVKRRLAEIVKRNMNFAVFHIIRSADLLWKSAVGDVHNG